MSHLSNNIRAAAVFANRKNGRYVRDVTGFLRGEEGEPIDLHVFLTGQSSFLDVMPIETKIMRASGLHPGGFALVSRAGMTREGAIMVVRYNGQTVIRKLAKSNGKWLLVADDPREKPLEITDDVEVEKLGVITAAIVKL